MKKKWLIDPEAEDWQCDWEGSERLQLHHFRSFSLREKFEAIEHMREMVEYFREMRLREKVSQSPKSVLKS